jgi:hypothetical protein
MSRRFAVVAAVCMVVLTLPLGATSRAADPEIYGYSIGSTIADAISFIYDQPSFGLPAEHTFELRKVHATSAVDSGPSGHALSSVLWPGDVVGNAPLALAIDLFVQDPTSARYLDCDDEGTLITHTCVPALDVFRSMYQTFKDDYKAYNNGEEFNPPPYPVRAEAYFPPGQSDENSPGAGIYMMSHAEEKLATAEARTQDAGMEGALTIKSMKSSSTSGVLKGVAVSEAKTFLTDVDLFGGVLHIGQITTTLRATSDGVKGENIGSVKVAGLTVGGTELFVDKTGFHACNTDAKGKQTCDASADPLGQAAAKIIRDNLEKNGISLSVAQPLPVVDGAQATNAVSGVIITMNATGMDQLVTAMPEPFESWLRNPTSSPFEPLPPDPDANPFDQLSSQMQGFAASPFTYDQQMQIVLGSVAVSSAASPPFDFSLPEVPIPEFPTGPIGGGDTFAPPAQPAGALQEPPRQQQPFFAVRPVGVSGVPGGLTSGVLILALLAALLLRRLAMRAVATEATETCSLERS